MSMGRNRGALARLVASLLALTMVAAACGEDDDDSADGGGGESTGSTAAAPAGEPYRIGVVLPLSGPVASIGTIQNTVFQAWVDYVNEVEGGINGRPIELEVTDDGGDAARAATALRSLADDGVIGVFGVPLASSVASAQGVVEELELSLLTIGAVPSLLRENPQYLFQVDATSGSDAEPMTTFASDLLADDDDDIRLALAPHDSPSSVEWTEAIRGHWADENGLSVVANVTVPLAAADVTAQAQEIVSSEPDILMMQGVDAGMPVLIGRVRSLGFDGPIVVYHGSGSDANLRTLNDPDVYVQRELRSFDEDASEYPGLARYIEVVERADMRDDAEAFVQHGLGTFGFLAIEAALKACADPCDRTQFNEALSGISVDTEGLAFGDIEYSATDRQGVTESVFYHLDGGEIVPALDGQSYHGDVYTMEG